MKWGERAGGAAGDAEVFGAAADEEIGAIAGDSGDGGEDFVKVFGQGQREEVVQVGDLVADGDLCEADGDCELFEGDAGAAVGGEDAPGGVQDVGAAGAVSFGGGGGGWRRLGPGRAFGGRGWGSWAAGWGFFSVLWQGESCWGVLVGVLASGLRKLGDWVGGREGCRANP